MENRKTNTNTEVIAKGNGTVGTGVRIVKHAYEKPTREIAKKISKLWVGEQVIYEAYGRGMKFILHVEKKNFNEIEITVQELDEAWHRFIDEHDTPEGRCRIAWRHFQFMGEKSESEILSALGLESFSSNIKKFICHLCESYGDDKVMNAFGLRCGEYHVIKNIGGEYDSGFEELLDGVASHGKYPWVEAYFNCLLALKTSFGMTEADIEETFGSATNSFSESFRLLGEFETARERTAEKVPHRTYGSVKVKNDKKKIEALLENIAKHNITVSTCVHGETIKRELRNDFGEVVARTGSLEYASGHIARIVRYKRLELRETVGFFVDDCDCYIEVEPCDGIFNMQLLMRQKYISPYDYRLPVGDKMTAATDEELYAKIISVMTGNELFKEGRKALEMENMSEDN